jgi:hypothetical protein
MKKATLVLATAVAFLLSGPVFAARKVVNVPTSTVISGSTSTIAENGVIKVSGSALVGEFIPGVKNALAIIPKTEIASSAISGLAKNVIKGGLAGIAVGAALDGLISGVGWIQGEGGQIQKQGAPIIPTDIVPGDYYWSNSTFGNSNSPAFFESAFAAYWKAPTNCTYTSTTIYTCTATLSNGATPSNYAQRLGNGCTSPRVLVNGSCGTPGKLTALSPSDYDVLDGFVKGKDGVWQRDLTSELCGSNEDCYNALNPQPSLSGPAKVTGQPQTVTTTAPNGSVSTSVKTPTTTITYGPNYYDYSTTTTTTNNNGGDTTTVTDDTDTSFPVPPDIFGGANDGIGGVRDGIPNTSSSTSPIPYMAWWSFSQSCNEITFVIPIYGSVTTALCPIYKQYIWPVLYFFFAVFTWLTCFEIWRKTVMRVRAS